jgi:hypothetical protein
MGKPISRLSTVVIIHKTINRLVTAATLHKTINQLSTDVTTGSIRVQKSPRPENNQPWWQETQRETEVVFTNVDAISS